MNTDTNFTPFFIASTQVSIFTTDKFENINNMEFLAKLKECPFGAKDGSHFLRTGLKTNDIGLLPRNDENTDSFANILIIDCDKSINKITGEEKEGCPPPERIHEILKSNNIAHIIYASYSHYVGTKGNRYRIIIFTNRPYSRHELSPTLESMISFINSHLDDELLIDVTENHVWSQPWYYQRRPQNTDIPPLYHEFLNGKAFEITQSYYEPVHDKLIQKDSTYKNGKINPIDAFNKQYKISNQLKQYGYELVYCRGDSEKWISPNSTTGCAGITVKNNRCFSHHGNDVLNDGYWHDSFDVMKLCEGLSENDAVKKAAQLTFSLDGRTVDEYNKANFSGHEEYATDIVINFEQYTPFNDELLPVEAVPYEALPESMTNFIKEYSVIRGCPPDYILSSLLARLGCVFAGKVKVALTKNTNWLCSPNFFWMMIGNPSSGKSNAFSLTDKPIKTLEAAAREQYKNDLKKYKEDFELL